MSSVGITTDFFGNRSQLLAELRALENDVKLTATRLKGAPLKLVIDFDANQAAQAFRRMMQNLQTTARNSPIVIPVVFQPQGGLPGMGGGGGGITNVMNVVNQTSNVNNAMSGAGGAPGAGGAGGGRLFMRGIALYGAHHSISMLRHELQNMSELRDIGNDVSSENIPQSIRQVRKIVEDEDSGVVGWARRNSLVYRGLYGNPENQIQGINQTLSDTERSERRVANTAKGISEVRSMGNKIIGATQGSGAARIAELEQWAAQEERLANDLRAQGQKRLGDRVSASAGVILAIERGRIAGEENALVSRTSLQVAGIGAEANEAVMRASGRGTEANFEARQRARGERLARAQIALNAETDPVRKAQLQRVLVAEQLAAPQEAAADRLGLMRDTTQGMRSANIATTAANLVTAGRPREASLYSRNAAIDERLRQQREEANNTRDPFVRGQLQTRLRADTAAGEAEKRANIAEDWRRTLDAIEQNTIAKDQARLQIARSDAQAELQIFDKQTERRLRKIESAEEKKSFTEARAEERRALQAEQTQRHFSFRAQTLDIMLRTRGQGGLADELGIEDEFRQNRLAAGNDPRAKQDALDRYRARLNQFVRGSWSPQMFNSFAQFDEAAQMSIINRDAMGLQRARRALAGVAGLQGKDLGALNPENAGGFGPEDVEKFNTATGKLDKAADKLGQNTLVAVKF
jgi:hypothetical protein